MAVDDIKTKNNQSSDGNTTIVASDGVSVKTKGSGWRSKIMLGVVIVALLIVALIWWLEYRKYVSTDDANLDSYRVDIAAQASGRMVALYVKEGDVVKEGELMFELDSASLVAQRDQAVAQYNQIMAQNQASRLDIDQARMQSKISQLQLQLAESNYQRAKQQYEGAVIPYETFQTIQQSWKTAELECEIAQQRVLVAESNLRASQLSSDAAMASVESINTNLSYYRVVAPADGVIGKRWYLPGDVISAGQTVLSLNQGNQIWVAIYLQETKYDDIYMGQDVRFTLDAYDGLTFYGRVYYMGDNSASQFSLVPPNNASGNYTKVTQRIPLKVSVDSVSGDHRTLKDIKLVSGMSANVKIVKR